MDFAGWEMPVQYEGVRQEHLNVRAHAGVFDVSHMGEIATSGSEALPLLQRLLSNDGALNWSTGDWSGKFAAQNWQTLQEVTSPITPPYNREPQITANYTKYDWNGFDVSVHNDFTRFTADPTQQGGQPNGDRAYSITTVSRPFLTPGTYVILKVILNATAYQFDSPLTTNGATSADRVVPTFSLDSGAVFERDADYFGPAVNRVARLLSLGYGGQVLVSRTAADLLQAELPPKCSLR